VVFISLGADSEKIENMSRKSSKDMSPDPSSENTLHILSLNGFSCKHKTIQGNNMGATCGAGTAFPPGAS
jgi:hypothetical protein